MPYQFWLKLLLRTLWCIAMHLQKLFFVSELRWNHGVPLKGSLLRMFCFLCFSSAVSNKLNYTGDEPNKETPKLPVPKIQTGGSLYPIAIWFWNSKTISHLKYERLLVMDFCFNDFSEISLAYLLCQFII